MAGFANCDALSFDLLSFRVMVPSKSVKKMIFGLVFMAGRDVESIDGCEAMAAVVECSIDSKIYV